MYSNYYNPIFVFLPMPQCPGVFGTPLCAVDLSGFQELWNPLRSTLHSAQSHTVERRNIFGSTSVSVTAYLAF